MKKTHVAIAFTMALSLAALLRADDTVVLNDGSSLQGQVMQESSTQVVVMDHGVQRTIDRSLVAKVEFNTSPSSTDAAASSGDAAGGNTIPSAPAPSASAPSDGGAMGPDGGNTVPSASSEPMDGGNTVPAPTQDEQAYADGVSAYYQIPSDQVWGFEQQGIPYEELPVVFYVARRAMCAPGLVVGLRLRGMSWADICMHFGLNPGIFYWRNLSSLNLGGPYGGIYMGFGRYPHHSWSWSLLALSDADIINCVNLRFSTGYWHISPYDVARWRGLGHPYFWGGYGYGRGHWRGQGPRAYGRVGFGVHGGFHAGYGGHANYGHGNQGHVNNGHGNHAGGEHGGGMGDHTNHN